MSGSILIDIAYFGAAVLFILGLKRMGSPVTARSGIVWAGIGMVIATLVTFFHAQVEGNYLLMVIAIAISGSIAWVSGKKVAMTDMPQMIALYNGMGGGAAAAIAAIELLKDTDHSGIAQALAVIGAVIGSIAFTGSLIAYAKLQGIMKKVYRFPMQQAFNLAVFIAMTLLAINIAVADHPSGFQLFLMFALALTFGILMTIPIGGADMPVIISLYNAFTGLAVGFEGFVMENPAMMIAGIVVGSAGTLLTQLMAKAMNRPISNVLFSSFGSGDDSEVTEGPEGAMKATDATDAAIQMAYAEKVIIIPGYGMAVAQAQHKIWELTELLEEKGVSVSFAIHPVAGRMPGHMNVLLAEAGVPYDKIYDLDEINNEFVNADVALVIGANDVVNPSAREDKSSPIYGMPILNADVARNVIVIKRGQGSGFSGIENHLFFLENTRMLYGDGQAAAGDLIAAVKML